MSCHPGELLGHQFGRQGNIVCELDSVFVVDVVCDYLASAPYLGRADLDRKKKMGTSKTDPPGRHKNI